MRAARAEVDLGAIAHNVTALRALAAPGELCAVVKADGYGHGAIAVSQAAVAAGATWLAVALVEEGAVLRRSGIEVPILLLSQPRLGDIEAAVYWNLALTLYSRAGIEAAGVAARAAGRTVPVHLKVNTGMNRVGASPDKMLDLAHAVADESGLELQAVWTHCAMADEPGHPFTDTQLDRFDAVVDQLAAAGIEPPMQHVANSAAAIDHPRARRSMIRSGIAVYGISPSPALADKVDLHPAMSLRAEVSMVKRVGAGEGVSYGLRHTFGGDTTLATVPIGYADGVPRRLSMAGGEVLIGGKRRPIRGVVTMDQLMVDCGDDDVADGDDVVLIGQQGDEEITAQEWADRVDTIPYEIVCGIGPRVPRFYVER